MGCHGFVDVFHVSVVGKSAEHGTAWHSLAP